MIQTITRWRLLALPFVLTALVAFPLLTSTAFAAPAQVSTTQSHNAPVRVSNEQSPNSLTCDVFLAPCYATARFYGQNYGGRTQVGVMQKITCSSCGTGGNSSGQTPTWLASFVADYDQYWPSNYYDMMVGYTTWQMNSSTVVNAYFFQWYTSNVSYFIGDWGQVPTQDFTHAATFLVYYTGNGSTFAFEYDAYIDGGDAYLTDTTGINQYNIMPGSQVYYPMGNGISFNEPQTSFGWNEWMNSARHWNFQTQYYATIVDYPFNAGWITKPNGNRTGGEWYTSCPQSQCD